MKTEVKFRELPEKVKKFLRHKRFYPCNNWFESDTVDDEWMHRLPEWSQATDEERLAYAEWRYPVGTVLAKSGINDWVRPEILMPIENCKFSLHENIIDTQDGYGYVYCKKTNRWAEIVSLPDIKEASAQQEFVKANPGMQHIEEPKEINDKSSVEIFNDEFNEACRNQDKSNCPLVEPKAGDMVEASDDGIDWKKYQRHTHTYRGIKRLYDGHFICENQDGFISTFKFIRLPQKSEVESKVKELMGDMLPIKFVGYENTYVNWDEAKEKMIEIAKWGQANPDKI